MRHGLTMISLYRDFFNSGGLRPEFGKSSSRSVFENIY
jgi:hypothetical protein